VVAAVAATASVVAVLYCQCHFSVTAAAAFAGVSNTHWFHVCWGSAEAVVAVAAAWALQRAVDQ